MTRDERLEYMRRYRLVNKDRMNEKRQQYREANRERLREKDRAYFAANRDKMREKSQRWRDANIEKVREQARNVYYTSGKARLAKIRIEYNQLKLSIGCQNPGCKWDGPFKPEMLEFHHIDRKTKKRNVSSLFSTGASKQLIDEEMAKCRLLCANCHKVETYAQFAHF